MKVTPVPSRGQSRMKVFTFGKAAYLRLGDATEVKPDRICFSEGQPVAAECGGFIYVADQHWSRMTTKHINEFALGDAKEEDFPFKAARTPTVRMSPDEFDFVLGSLLTKHGLPLTRRPREEK